MTSLCVLWWGLLLSFLFDLLNFSPLASQFGFSSEFLSLYWIPFFHPVLTFLFHLAVMCSLESFWRACCILFDSLGHSYDHLSFFWILQESLSLTAITVDVVIFEGDFFMLLASCTRTCTSELGHRLVEVSLFSLVVVWFYLIAFLFFQGRSLLHNITKEQVVVRLRRHFLLLDCVQGHRLQLQCSPESRIPSARVVTSEE